MKNLKAIILLLALGLMSNVVYAQSNTIKVEKKSVNSTHKKKVTPVSNEKRVEQPKVKSNSQPSKSYTPKSSGSSNHQGNNLPQKESKPAQGIKSSGGNNSIPSSSIKRESSKK